MKKPYPEFPLTAHRNGQWCKKINGKLHYFGKLDNWMAALELYHAEIDYLKLGKTPPGKGVDLHGVLNMVMDDKAAARMAGEITASYFASIRTVCRHVTAAAGKRAPVDMGPQAWAEVRATLAASLAPTTLTLHINVINSMLRHAFEMGYIDALPKTGPAWSVPNAKVMREHLAKRDRLVTPEQFHGYLAKASPQFRACLWLGLNCAYGPMDLSQFTMAHIKDGVASMSRSKTGTHRQAVLWPETVAAIQGQLPLGMGAGHISAKMGKLMRPHTAYDLRHTFATNADQFRDSRAVDVVMGHSDGSVRATYRHGVEVERLRDLSEFVRGRFAQHKASAPQ